VSLRRRMGPTPRMRPEPPARPVHAGRLPRWEQLAFALVFALMISFVVVVSISAARDHGRPPAASSSVLPPSGDQPGSALYGSGAAPADPVPSPVWDRRLRAALAPLLRAHTGQLAVGIVDRATGAVAVYGGGQRFHTASIVKTAILAALLLGRQAAGTPLGAASQQLATQMIETSDDDAATQLWNRIGRAAGLARADARLGLAHTTPGPAEYWGLTSTTVADQLGLLTDLVSPRSPLDAAARGYELRLLRGVAPAQRWGVPAAASPGSVAAVKDGWLPDGPAQLWVINSIGVLDRDHQQLLVAVLSSGQPTEAAGIAQDQAAAIAAAGCLTAVR
jgi:Beta-lactamase enzyme family